MDKQLVTVYIPTKNRLTLLKRAINSVLKQSYRNIELIVVDDASTDCTKAYLVEMQNKGVLRAILFPVSMGACVARNFAIAESKGVFVTGLDDDDFFLPSRIEAFIFKWRNTETNYIGGRVAGIFDNMTLIDGRGEHKSYDFPLVVNYGNLLEMNGIGNQVFAPRQHYLNAGLFDPCMPVWQDWDLWIRMSKLHGSFINLGIGTYVVDQSHRHERITSKPEFMIRFAKASLECKYGIYSQRNRASLLISCLSYPQVKPNIIDIYLLARAGRLTSLINFLRKMFKSY